MSFISRALKINPIISEEKMLEVSIVDDQAVIKLSTWVDDLGWCGEKTLSLNADMLDELHRAVTLVRYQANKEKQTTEKTKRTSNIINFPGIK